MALKQLIQSKLCWSFYKKVYIKGLFLWAIPSSTDLAFFLLSASDTTHHGGIPLISNKHENHNIFAFCD